MAACTKIKILLKQPFIHRFAAKYNVTVMFKYLQVGHTFMECDSAHRCIENQVNIRDINVPHDYISVVKNARNRPFPYKVRFDDILPYTFFKDYEADQDVPSIRPGSKVNDPTVLISSSFSTLQMVRYHLL